MMTWINITRSEQDRRRSYFIAKIKERDEVSEENG